MRLALAVAVWLCAPAMLACSSRDAGDDSATHLTTIPIGYDAYRDWERMPTLRIGARSYMRSTYDRSGGNEGADAGHFLRAAASDFYVTLDLAGPGIVYFTRANHWHGSPWHYVVDGHDYVVSESSTNDPSAPVTDSKFVPDSAFPSPLALTWSQTQGADLSWVPIAFEHTFTLAYGRTHYGTGYYIYQLFPQGAANLSHALASFALDAPSQTARALLRSAGSDIAPSGDGVDTRSGEVDVAPGGSALLATLDGARTVRALKLRFSSAQASAAASVRMRITWDGRAQPSVDAPLPLFFGTGTFYNRDGQEWLVRGLLANVHFQNDAIELASYFPMPFFTHARIELVSTGAALAHVRFELRSTTLPDDDRSVGYFHATYRDHGTPQLGHDLVILDTRAVEGGGDTCGSFNGMSFIFSHAGDLSTLEGDPRFFFDDSQSPQAYGTGTEEWAGGGDYWGGQNVTLPLAGHPTGAQAPWLAQNNDDLIESAYRFLIADALPFGKNARIQLEHGALDDSTEHYESVAYWYGAPLPCLAQTDALDVGDEADEHAHHYVSKRASAVETIQSRYELGPDQVGGTQIFGETRADGRHTTGTSEFRLRVRRDNVGVLLRRTLDYALPDQRAEVFVADDRDGAPFASAGVWYLAGSNHWVYSNPPGETDPPDPMPRTSNRRLRDDEFMIPPDLTAGRAAIRVRITPTGPAYPVLPGDPVPPQIWSELAYRAYSWVLPQQ
jgi:hypothetical protein